MRRAWFAVVALVCLVGWFAQTASAQSPTRLPVKRIVLYRNGVGYFEHMGRVAGNQELSVDFTSAQLNDVLKSLTIVDMGEGRITGVRYDSTAPLSERMKTLRLAIGEQTSEADFLGALRGARVDVRSGASSAVGKVLAVEKRIEKTKDGDEIERAELSIVTDAGELRTFMLGPGTSVRIADRELNEEVARYLDLVGSTRSRDLRRMVISTAGSGERDVYVGYISEVPVWKSTYRLLLPSTDSSKARLQGWAIVDNTVGEDWNGVQLTLVAGSPQSFVQDISKPFYTRRPVVALPSTMMLTPQSHEATLQGLDGNLQAPPAAGVVGAYNGPIAGPAGKLQRGGIAGGVFVFKKDVGSGLQGRVTDAAGAVIPNALVTIHDTNGTVRTARTDSGGNYSFFNLPTGEMRISVASPGFSTSTRRFYYGGSGQRIETTLNVGAASETVEVNAEAAQPMGPSEEELAQNFEAIASGAASGVLFRYDIKQKITIGKNQSALVPIINAPIDAERVTLWSASNGDRRPALRAVWLKNTSDLTLDAGTFSILDGNTFAGEGLIEPLKPGERRLVSYAADGAVRVAVRDSNDVEPVTAVRIAKGLMSVTRGQSRITTYKVHDGDQDARDVVIEHPVQEGWKLTGAAKPEESTTSFYRFRVRVKPDSTEDLKVQEFRPQQSTYAISSLTPDLVAFFVSAKTIPATVEEAFRHVLSEKNDISSMDDQIRQRQQEIESINTDQSRLRENMKALKGSAEERALVQRYTRQLDQQEDRLATLRKELAGLQEQRQAAQAELDRMIEAIKYSAGEAA